MSELEALQQINWNLRKRKLARMAKSESAKRGVSTEWKRRGQACKRMFGG